MTYFYSPGKNRVSGARRVKKSITGFMASDAWTSLFEVESRSADCGRDESGRFGQDNKCQENAGSGAFSTDSNASWTPGSGDEPFDGASKYGEVRTSAGKKVSQSLDAMGLDPGDAVSLTGAPDGAEVWLRPANEFSSSDAFEGGDATPVFISFESDAAGVRRGVSGSSVLGRRKNKDTGEQELVLYHNVFDVLPDISNSPAKRHTVARDAYRTMVASIESARKSGIAEIKFNAAGRSADQGSKTAFRGYTIWPRMGFDAPLPPKIRERLPESLSHAKSLLDLHATREGTRWWADNGEELDVTLRIADRSSPQNQIVDKFIKHLFRERRDIAMGSGEGWLSPQDLVLLDEMWDEVWDEGILDDYEWVEQRSADCGRDESGRFGPKNDCASEDGGTSLPARSPGSGGRLTKSSFQRAVSPGGPADEDPNKSLSLLQTGRRFEVVGSFRKNINPREPLKAAQFVRDFLSGMETQAGSLDRGFASEVALRIDASIRNSGSPSIAADNAACLVASIASAVVEYPAITGSPLFAMTSGEVFDRALSEGANPLAAASMARDASAFYSIMDDTITINTDAADSFILSIANNAFAKNKAYSSSHPGHALIHEDGHRIHHQEIRRSLGLPVGKRLSQEKTVSILNESQRRVAEVVDYFKSGEDGERTAKKVQALSQYGASHPAEFVAEYFVGLTVKSVARDSDLDKVMVMLGFPADRIPEGKKKRK